METIKCDICGKQCDLKNARQAQVPAKYYGEKLYNHSKEIDRNGKIYFKTTENIIMCDKCFDYFWKLNDRGFASVETSVKQKTNTGDRNVCLDVCKNF